MIDGWFRSVASNDSPASDSSSQRAWLIPGDSMPLTEADEIRDALDRQLDLIIDSGHCGIEPTTVIDLTGDTPRLVREGMGRDHGLD